VQDSKDKATSALQTIPSIINLIEQGEEKTDTARQNYAGAEVNAQRSNATAQEALKKYAEQAAKVTEELSTFWNQGALRLKIE
jgi:hypothetical protein